MAVSTKPTIVIVSAGWHQPVTYSKLTRALEQAGFEVEVPALPSNDASRPPKNDLQDDIAAIRKAVTTLCESGKKVIALLHSYGGQVGTSALVNLGVANRSAHGLHGGVVQLIYMAAFAMPEGKCMMDKVEEHGQLDLIPQAFDFADDKSVLSLHPKELLVGLGVSDAEADDYISTFVRWNGQTMYQNIDRCAWREIPVTYFHTSSDMTVPLYYQESMTDMMAKAGVKVKTFTFESGHCPNLTATKEVVDAIEQVAAASGAVKDEAVKLGPAEICDRIRQDSKKFNRDVRE